MCAQPLCHRRTFERVYFRWCPSGTSTRIQFNFWWNLSMSGPGCWQYLHPQLPGRQVAVYDMFRSNRFQIDFALNNKRSVPCCTMHSLAAGFLNCSNQSWHLFMPITYLAMACMQICNFAMRRMPPTTPHKVGGPSLSNLTCNIYIYIFF